MATKNSKGKKLNEKEIEKLVVELSKKGLTNEKIGLILKQEHGIYLKKLGTKISRILEKNNIKIDPDITNLKKRIAALKQHLAKNKHDYKSRISLLVKEAKLRKLEKYRKLR